MICKKPSDLLKQQARINEIPLGWHLTRVKKAVEICNQFRKPINEEERGKIPGNYPYYGATSIVDYISTYEQDGRYALIGEDGDHFLKYKDFVQTQIVEGRATVNNHAHVIKGTAYCSVDWFYVFFMHRDITHFLSRQGAKRYKLNKGTLEGLPILLPPLAEQEKIAEILSTWDHAIEQTERLKANAETHKQALMQQLLTGKKRFPEFEGEWKEKALGNIVKISKGKALTSKNIVEGDYPVIAGGQTSPYNHNEYTHENVITVSASGAYAGFVAFHNYKIWASDCSVIEESKKVKILYIYYFLSFQQERIYTYQSGGAQPHIYPRDLAVMKIKLPSPEEQQKIAAVLNTADREIELLAQKLDYLKTEKRALMQQLLTGKRRVKVDG